VTYEVKIVDNAIWKQILPPLVTAVLTALVTVFSGRALLNSEFKSQRALTQKQLNWAQQAEVRNRLHDKVDAYVVARGAYLNTYRDHLEAPDDKSPLAERRRQGYSELVGRFESLSENSDKPIWEAVKKDLELLKTAERELTLNEVDSSRWRIYNALEMSENVQNR
jgi:hypothetical protein